MFISNPNNDANEGSIEASNDVPSMMAVLFFVGLLKQPSFLLFLREYHCSLLYTTHMESINSHYPLHLLFVMTSFLLIIAILF